jgi:dienelactone hydrolase
MMPRNRWLAVAALAIPAAICAQSIWLAARGRPARANIAAAGTAASGPAGTWAAPSTAAAAEADRYASAGGRAVETADYDWHDKARDRDVPAKVYYPRDADGNCPVIFFSHGLGGSREGYAYLGRHWAGHGYVSVHLTHIGSDSNILKGDTRPADALHEALANPRNAIARAKDVSFAIDRLVEMHASDERLKGRLAMNRVGLAGHSFGGHTVLACAGQRAGLAVAARSPLAEPRIRAAIAMSPPARDAAASRLDMIYSDIRIPIFHMTGTLDDSPIGDVKAAQRRLPFDHIRGAEGYLLTLKDGDHMVFSGRPGLAKPTDEPHHRLILAGSTAFWDACLKNDNAARSFLTGGEYARQVADDGTFETNPKGGSQTHP